MQKGWLKVVKFLAENGADLDAKDARGRTALDYAKGNGGAGGRGQAATGNKEAAALLEKLIAERPPKQQ